MDVKSRHVAVTGSAVKVYCSDACLRGADHVEETAPIDEPRRIGWLIATGIAVGGALVALVHSGFAERRSSEPPPAPLPIVAAPIVQPAVATPSPEETARRTEDDALLGELMQDAWIHPLAGPHRRMPINHTAAFGAERPGERPPECASGHCGVDVGNTWGEPVHAVHDGVVDWVNRGPNEERGGIFVKIAHRGGGLFSWYFHLAAVPRWIQPGVKITAGQVIGLLGDTGVKNSGPHLHFSISVKPSKDAHERYLDPEPLIAIWPLWIPDEAAGHGHLSIVEPGMPVRSRARAKPIAPPAPVVEASSPTPEPPPSAEGSGTPAANPTPTETN